MPTKEELKILQSLPLDVKVMKTLQRIREFVQYFGDDGVAVSFSGGKDSTVLLHLVRSIYPNVKAVFGDTGLEYPEIRNFVKTVDNVDWVKPQFTFGEIVTQCGYPLFSKETAEAIYYARRIVGGGGGQQIPLPKQVVAERNCKESCKTTEQPISFAENWNTQTRKLSTPERKSNIEKQSNF